MVSEPNTVPKPLGHTLERLKELLAFSPSTGCFRWRVSRGKARVGALAGCVLPGGRVLIRIEGRAYLAHHLAWLFSRGFWPSLGLDHRNGNPGDNRPRNLREATQSINMQNLKGPRRDGTSGFLGVSLYKPNGKYRATIFANGRHKSLGYFTKPLQASKAYLAAKRLMHPGCTL